MLFLWLKRWKIVSADVREIAPTGARERNRVSTC
jgi:hypothetical protein